MAFGGNLLKDGTRQFTGVEEVILRNIEACSELSHKTRTSYGPNSMNKMVINQHDRIFVTNDAATIIKELEVVHPAAKMLVLASQMQDQEVGDGTNFVVTLGGELLTQAETLIRTGLHPSEIIEGYSRASEKALKIVEDLATVKVADLTDVKEVTKMLKSVIAAKQFGWENLLAPIIAEACIEVLPRGKPSNFSVDNVRVAKLLGRGVTDTSLVHGFVITRDSEGAIKHVKDAKIAVFVGGFDASKPETKGTVVIKSAKELQDYSKGEETQIEQLVKEITSTGANVVVSGGPVGDMALHFLERAGLMVVKVPSKFDIRRLCKSTGATPLVRLGAPSAEELGHSDSVSVDEVAGQKVCIFKRQTADKNSLISTIVVRASTDNILDDIERCIDDAVNVYKGMCRDSRFVPGAAATEIELARQLHTLGESSPGLDQYAIKHYADAFEIFPRILAENAGLNSTDVISSLYASHQSGNVSDGVDVEGGGAGIKNSFDAGVFDLFLTKYWGIKFASDAAITILRVDMIIMSKPAGGPKVPKQGPQDSDD